MFCASVTVLSGLSLHSAEITELGWLASSASRECIVTPRRAPVDWEKRSAAVSVNQEWEKDRDKPWYVEMQREGARWVEAGIVHGDQACVNWGLRQLAWGFEQMQSDGSFRCQDPFHSASFLVESTARSLLLLRASSQKNALPAAAQALMPPLLTCARWLSSPVHEKTLGKQRIYTHRRFLLGCALEQTACLHDDESLHRSARGLVADGLSLQRDDGAFPEKGGHDSSYHAVALIYLQRYEMLMQPGPWRESCHAATERGIQWLLSRIDSQGNVSVEGNTRTGAEQEVGRSGIMKQINLPEVATALMMHAYRCEQPRHRALAEKVIKSRSTSR
jgi:hypothetical protein